MGMLQNLGASWKRRLGLTGPSEEELKQIKERAQAESYQRLDQLAKDTREKSKLAQRATELREGISLTFGDKERSRNLTAEQRSVRSTGRFNTDRLVL